MNEVTPKQKRIRQLVVKILDRKSTKDEDKEYNGLKRELGLSTAQIMEIPLVEEEVVRVDKRSPR